MDHPGAASFMVRTSPPRARVVERRLPRLAPLAQRLAGFLCDSLILYVIWGLASRGFFAVLPEGPAEILTIFFGVPYVLGFVAIGVTPGSWMVGIRIVERFGRPPGLRRSFERSLVPPLIWAVTILLLVYEYPPVQKIDYLLETHPDLDVLFLVAIYGGTVALTLLDLVKSGRLGMEHHAWHGERCGTYVIQTPTRFWPWVRSTKNEFARNVRWAADEVTDRLRLLQPWRWTERQLDRRRFQQQRAMREEREKQMRMEREAWEAHERAVWSAFEQWIDELPDSTLDRLQAYIDHRRAKSR